MSYWYKDDELEEDKVPHIPPPCFPDVFVVEPSRQDRYLLFLFLDSL